MGFINAARGATGGDRGTPQIIDRLGGAIETNNQFFLTKASTRSREWWRREAVEAGTDWHAILPRLVQRLEELFGRLEALEDECSPFAKAVEAEHQRQAADRRGDQHPRPTPQSTIEAVWYCVRTRGVAALQEPTNNIRLQAFDEAARTELNARINRMMAGYAEAAE